MHNFKINRSNGKKKRRIQETHYIVKHLKMAKTSPNRTVSVINVNTLF